MTTSYPVSVVSSLADGFDFPYLVMEFFHDGYEFLANDAKLCLDVKSNHVNQALLDAYDMELDCFLVDQVDIPDTDARVFHGRWEHVKTIVVIEPSPVQIYFARSLNHPHYNIHPLEYEAFKKHLEIFAGHRKGAPTLHYCSANKNHTDIGGMVTITNIGMSQPLQCCIRSFPLDDLVNLVSLYGKTDDKRGNIQFDTGLTSSVCQKRCTAYWGVAGPNERQQTKHPAVKTMYKLLYNFLDMAVPKEFKGKVYSDPQRRVIFGFDKDVHQDPNILIQSVRVAAGRKNTLLAPHRDRNNDNEDPMFAPVLVLSWLVKVAGFDAKKKGHCDQVDMRIAIIVYSRKFVAETLTKIQKYGKAIKDLTAFYKKKEREGKVDVSPNIFAQVYSSVGSCNLNAARITPRMDTVVHWSAMGADALLKINRRFSPNYQQGLALLYSVCACESPDLFRVFTTRLLSDEKFGADFFQKDAISIAITVYEIIWELKGEVAVAKQGMKGQRHQPFANRKASRKVVHTSLTNLVDVCDTLNAWSGISWKCKKHVRTLYLSALDSLSANHTSTGVFGAGPLVANKLLQTGALVGLFPLQFLYESQIAASTNTHDFLLNRYKLKAVDIAAPILLDAVSYMTGTSCRVAEGICCKAGRAWHSKKGLDSEKRWVDTIYHDMSILTIRATTPGKLNSLSIIEITPQGERVVACEELQWLDGGDVKETPWAKCCGYWAESLDGPNVGKKKVKVNKTTVGGKRKRANVLSNPKKTSSAKKRAVPLKKDLSTKVVTSKVRDPVAQSDHDTLKGALHMRRSRRTSNFHLKTSCSVTLSKECVPDKLCRMTDPTVPQGTR